ncbi:hypothetical protein RB596_000196 [Gaeumannomyces avenae]
MASLGLSCPEGGQFFTCQGNKTEFIGCCTIDPCRDGTGFCPKSNLLQASFSSDAYDRIFPQNCSDQNGQWWTCKGNISVLPFIGCCIKNPCISGVCLPEDLTPARLSDNKTNASVFLASRSATDIAQSSSPPASAGDFRTQFAVAIALAGFAVLFAAAVLVYVQRFKKRTEGGFNAKQSPLLNTYVPVANNNSQIQMQAAKRTNSYSRAHLASSPERLPRVQEEEGNNYQPQNTSLHIGQPQYSSEMRVTSTQASFIHPEMQHPSLPPQSRDQEQWQPAIQRRQPATLQSQNPRHYLTPNNGFVGRASVAEVHGSAPTEVRGNSVPPTSVPRCLIPGQGRS